MRGSRLRRFVRNQDGSVILETALMLTILLLLMFGIVDIGRALYTENNLVSAAREGARFAATDATAATDGTNTKNTVIARFSPFGGPALQASDITVTQIFAAGGGAVEAIRVTIAYTFTWITPLPRLLQWTSSGTFTSTFHSQAEYRYEF